MWGDHVRFSFKSWYVAKLYARVWDRAHRERCQSKITSREDRRPREEAGRQKAKWTLKSEFRWIILTLESGVWEKRRHSRQHATRTREGFAMDYLKNVTTLWNCRPGRVNFACYGNLLQRRPRASWISRATRAIKLNQYLVIPYCILLFLYMYLCVNWL